MARNVFISFRFADGFGYKDELASLFDESTDTVDFSEDEDRSQMSEFTIQNYLYRKLQRASVTIVLLTPHAINYYKNLIGFYNDWLYDEVRYSLEYREGNPTKGLVAVYVPEAKNYLIEEVEHTCDVCKTTYKINLIKSVDNLAIRNLLNVKSNYKVNRCRNVFDSDYDSYCSLVPYDKFKSNFGYYIDLAFKKRNELYKYELCKRL